jgi:hypothetical protein
MARYAYHNGIRAQAEWRIVEQDPDQGTLADVPDPAVRRNTRHSPVGTNCVMVGSYPTNRSDGIDPPTKSRGPIPP